MPYRRQYERLYDAVKRMMATGVEQRQAQLDISGALADGKIRFRLKIDQADPFYGGMMLPQRNVGVPPELAPEDLYWDQSRPRHPWNVGPDALNPAERYFSTASWKPRNIILIELSTADVATVLCRDGTPTADQRDSAPEKKGHSGPKSRGIAEAIDQLWPAGLPTGLTAKERDKKIRDRLIENCASVPRDLPKAVQRVLAASKRPQH